MILARQTRIEGHSVRVKKVWQIQEAKNRFSELVQSALTGGVQTVTRHGKPVVVVVAAEKYLLAKPRRSIVEILRSCPQPGLDLRRVVDRPRTLKF